MRGDFREVKEYTTHNNTSDSQFCWISHLNLSGDTAVSYLIFATSSLLYSSALQAS